jgi:hypothetical protein
VLASRPVTLLVAIGVGAAFDVGLLLDGIVGAVVLLAVAALLGALTAAAWEHVPPRGRPLRLAVLGLVTAIAVVKLVSALA